MKNKLWGFIIPFLLFWCIPSNAQTTPAPYIPRLSVVDLRDTTLADACELLFTIGGNPPHLIDVEAKKVPIGTFVLNNIAWDAALRTIANKHNYKVSRNLAGAYVVSPRALKTPDLPSFSDVGPFLPTLRTSPQITPRFGSQHFVWIPLKHIYAGGVARLFGFENLNSEIFASPGQFGNRNGF